MFICNFVLLLMFFYSIPLKSRSPLAHMSCWSTHVYLDKYVCVHMLNRNPLLWLMHIRNVQAAVRTENQCSFIAFWPTFQAQWRLPEPQTAVAIFMLYTSTLWIECYIAYGYVRIFAETFYFRFILIILYFPVRPVRKPVRRRDKFVF